MWLRLGVSTLSCENWHRALDPNIDSERLGAIRSRRFILSKKVVNPDTRPGNQACCLNKPEANGLI